jgi:hypothetical protein
VKIVSIVPTEQQRQYFRLKLDPPLSADMTIVTINGKHLELGSAEVLIDDIGPGGLRFLTTLSLPVHSQVVLQFQTELFSQTVKMHGYIVRHSNLLEGINEYGVKLTMDEEKHAELARLINRLAIRLRQGNTALSGRFFRGDKLAFLRNSRQPNEA